MQYIVAEDGSKHKGVRCPKKGVNTRAVGSEVETIRDRRISFGIRWRG